MVQRITAPSFSALLTIGGRRGYTETPVSRDELVTHLQAFQRQLTEEKGVYLSTSITTCTVVLHEHTEPHFRLRFINYPRFPLDESDLKKHIGELAVYLMDQLDQNRVVVEYREETVMFQRNEEVDAGVYRG